MRPPPRARSAARCSRAPPPSPATLTYRPAAPDARRLALVGKGITYDSGGISLKPADPIHAMMKNDMSGAGAILAAMCALRDLDCPTAVTGWLMCTDNMPSGTALKMGDVLTVRGGKTVEVMNTDAEGRLVMADAMVLAAIHAAPFLYEFADGLPWAHIDMAGVADVEKPGSWRRPGCSGFGARLLAEFAVGF
jgi:leucyl aminopeptidase